MKPIGGVDGKVALVTGGASGIGAGVARRLAASGAEVVIADVDTAGGEAVAADIGGLFVDADVSRLEDNRAAIKVAVDQFARLDIVFLNAGIGEQGGFVHDFRPERYQRIRAVNLDGVIYGLHAALESPLLQSGGTIIATSSLAGLFESPYTPVYAATKHAVVGLVRSVAPTLKAHGITINALCPAAVDTAIWGEALPYVIEAGVAVMGVDRVADAVEAIITGGDTGQAWLVLPHEEPAPFIFPETPNLMISQSLDREAGPR